MLHHIQSPEKALERMLAALKRGGIFLSIEPDMLPATAAEPQTVRTFWQGWLQWSTSVGVDYFLGRKMPSLLAGLALDAVGGYGHTSLYNGGSPWAVYWLETLKELRPRLVESGHITERLMSELTTCIRIHTFGPVQSPSLLRGGASAERGRGRNDAPPLAAQCRAARASPVAEEMTKVLVVISGESPKSSLTCQIPV
jgi:hypothetical protein